MLLPGDGIQRLNQKRLPVRAGGSLNGKRLTPFTFLDYVKQEYPLDEHPIERDIEIHQEGDYARVIIERD